MEKITCPFCFDKNIEHISDVRIEGTDKTRPLYRCNNFESYFWGDTEEKAPMLSNLCKTRWLKPEKCSEDIYIFFPQHEFAGSTLGETKELDLICSNCPNKNFILKK
ncbi:MAG: hypothetical protein GTN73_03635 [Candidatus Aminicenantes bacterium]|nr:hypothetical protein [Candidatus Aminicenantes bacterium]